MKRSFILRPTLLVFAIVALTAAISCSAPTVSASEADGFHCQYCSMVSESSHKFNNVDCSETGNGCKDCHVLNQCHSDTQSGTCDGFTILALNRLRTHLRI